MKLYLTGHNYRYAVEQIMLALFPSARPEYPDGDPAPEDDCARVELSEDPALCRVALQVNGRKTEATQSGNTSLFHVKQSKDREAQRIIKLAFYHAAMELTEERPVWGALTGIRPGTIMTRLLERGLSGEEAMEAFSRDYFVSPERAALCLDTARASLRTERALKARDVALYVGIPFCPTRCAYCSFVSQSVEKSMGMIPAFLKALRREIAATAAAAGALGLRPVAVYIGGGTPTTLSAPELSALLGWLREEFDLSAVREFCVEAGRPDTVTEEKLQALRGVTRVSVNPQSMSDEVLAAIGRRHTAEDIRRAYALTRRTLACDVNMDLIAGLPADTPERFAATLDEVIGMGPENVTVHTLALKKGSRITEEDTARPGKDEVARMLDGAGEKLRAAGYSPFYLYRQKFMSGGFENVGWTKPGHESLYNILIMEELCTVLAMGGGGSTKLVDRRSGRIERVFDPKYPKEYVESLDKIVADKEKIAAFYAETQGGGKEHGI